MMDISTAKGFFAHFHGHFIKVKHADGTDWLGTVTARSEPDEDNEELPAPPPSVSFKRFADLETYKKNKPLYKGKDQILWLSDVLEIQTLG